MDLCGRINNVSGFSSVQDSLMLESIFVVVMICSATFECRIIPF